MNGWRWGAGELQENLTLCLEEACRHRPVVLLLDALDEMGEGTALEIVEYFQSLLLLRPKTIKHLHVCFSCRHYPAISFGSGYRIRVEEHNALDISPVVNSKLSGLIDSERLSSLILDRASGVFQWAVLVCGEARTRSRQKRMRKSIEKIVEQLPKGLENCIFEILEDSSTPTLRLLQWICFGKRPLSPAQLRQALTVETECLRSSSAEFEDILDFEDSLEGTVSMIKVLSRGLAQITRIEHSSSSAFQLNIIHQSVWEFLVRRGFEKLDGSLAPHPKEISSMCLMKVCLVYLRIHEEGKFSELDFGSYALTSWAFHALKAENQDNAQRFIIEYFDDSNQFRDGIPKSMIGIQQVKRTVRGNEKDVRAPITGFTTMAHVLVQSELFHALKEAIRREVFIDKGDDSGRSAFSVAVVERKLAAAQFLVGCGQTDINSTDCDMRTPLHHALRGEEELSQEQAFLADMLLCDDRINVDAKDINRETPLHVILSIARKMAERRERVKSGSSKIQEEKLITQLVARILRYRILGDITAQSEEDTVSNSAGEGHSLHQTEIAFPQKSELFTRQHSVHQDFRDDASLP